MRGEGLGGLQNLMKWGEKKGDGEEKKEDDNETKLVTDWGLEETWVALNGPAGSICLHKYSF